MKYPIYKCHTGDLSFTAEIDCRESVSDSVKKGLAVAWSRNNGANFTGAVGISIEKIGASVTRY